MNYEHSKTSIKFVYNHEGYSDEYTSFPPIKIEHTIDGESTLNECLLAFENFLLGCGYRLYSNENIGVVSND